PSRFRPQLLGRFRPREADRASGSGRLHRYLVAARAAFLRSAGRLERAHRAGGSGPRRLGTFMEDIYLLVDYKGHFGSKHGAIPYRSGLVKEKLSDQFARWGYRTV